MMFKQLWPWHDQETPRTSNMDVIRLCERQHCSNALLGNRPLGGSYPSVFKIDEQRYVVSGLAQLEAIAYEGNPSLATVISLDIDQTVTEAFLDAEIKEYKCIDDVFHVHFLQGAIFTVQKRSTADNVISSGALALLKSLGCEWIEIHAKKNDGALPIRGLYVASDKKLFEVYKAYDDAQGAFLESLLPGPDEYSMLWSSGSSYD
jgi:hypothetical protein